MGMYTQVRGWLNIDSIGQYDEGKTIKSIKNKLNKAQQNFLNDDTLLDLDGEKLERKWVCEDIVLYEGANGSKFLFIGTELKNYGNPAYEWIKYLLKYFPNAEGRIDLQYEEEHYWEDLDADTTCAECSNIGGACIKCDNIDKHGDKSRYLLIRGGKIIKDDYCKTWTIGYGNMYKVEEEK